MSDSKQTVVVVDDNATVRALFERSTENLKLDLISFDSKLIKKQLQLRAFAIKCYTMLYINTKCHQTNKKNTNKRHCRKSKCFDWNRRPCSSSAWRSIESYERENHENN